MEILHDLKFRHGVKGNCALLGYYTASISNFLPTLQDKILVPSPSDPWWWDRYVVPKRR